MRALLILCVFSVFIAIATAITCYDCNSAQDPRCNQYFYPKGVKETNCDEAKMPEYLKKYERRIPAKGCITKIYEGFDGNLFYIRRGCFFSETEDTDAACKADDPYFPFSPLLSCEVCEDDLCNTNFGLKKIYSKTALIISLLCTLGFYTII